MKQQTTLYRIIVIKNYSSKLDDERVLQFFKIREAELFPQFNKTNQGLEFTDECSSAVLFLAVCNVSGKVIGGLTAYEEK
ncbi:MAG TPA: hypothetical protein DIV86_06290, partial [Alphaproteobacteria bacterium]|nr:hypothetical protein [Alphaproteobacteria bacterium]